MSCRYCKRECDYAICLTCDAKHTAKEIFARVQRERTYYKDPRFFNETKIKERFKKSDVLGMEGLTADEVQTFWGTFEAEYERLKGEDLIKAV